MSEQLWNTAISGLIGGSFALGGAFAAGWFGLFSSKRERQHRYAERQLERLEKISDCIAHSMLWRDSFQTLTSFDTVRDTPPIRCVRPSTMLARIYFRDLVPHALAYQKCLAEYHTFAMMSYTSNYRDTCPVGAKMNLYDRDRWLQFSERLSSLRDAFDAAIEIEARKYETSA